MIGRREVLAVAAVADIALHARGKPVSAKVLAARHGLAPRHLEPLLRDLVNARILKGTRGPQGGYELARERRRISVGDILRGLGDANDKALGVAGTSGLSVAAVVPALNAALSRFLQELDGVSIETLIFRATPDDRTAAAQDPGGFVI